MVKVGAMETVSGSMASASQVNLAHPRVDFQAISLIFCTCFVNICSALPALLHSEAGQDIYKVIGNLILDLL